jgi:hypothetical protein
VQDRYAGDVGDFGKLGLLRCLCGVYPRSAPRLQLGILWYCVPDETHNNDGKHIGYLRSDLASNERFRCCDPELYQRLSRLIQSERSVRKLATLGLLGANSIHFLEPLSYGDIARRDRANRRRSWLAAALDATRDCHLVFIDPDNGLETSSVNRLRALGPKYAYFDDLEPFIERGQSLVIYQHVNRTAPVTEQSRLRIGQLQARFGVGSIWAVRYRRGSGRLYIVVPAHRDEAVLLDRTRSLLDSSWGRHGHFELMAT